MIKNKFILFILFLVLLFMGTNAFASTTNGTIDSTYHYAWGENIGWVDFANVTVSDTGLSGSIYGENVGWIDVSTIINTPNDLNYQADLSGYAWGENIGWVDFSKAAIGTNGVFTGGIYGENIGWIIFDNGNSKIATDYRPSQARVIRGSGPLVLYTEPAVIPVTTTAPPLTPPSFITPTSPVSTICNMGEKFNTTSGLPCTAFTQTPGAQACIITQTLRQGNKGEQVECLQNKLNIISDGSFGKNTKKAVIVFQKENKLFTDGIVGSIVFQPIASHHLHWS